MNQYFNGALVRVTGTFTNQVTGETENPDTVTVVVSVNRGVIATYVGVGSMIVNPSPGVFYVDLDTTGAQGTWCARFTGTGTVQAVDAVWFVVQPNPS